MSEEAGLSAFITTLRDFGVTLVVLGYFMYKDWKGGEKQRTAYEENTKVLNEIKTVLAVILERLKMNGGDK